MRSDDYGTFRAGREPAIALRRCPACGQADNRLVRSCCCV